MANAIWPAGLPQDVLRGYEERWGDSRLRSPMDKGPAKVRPRTTAVVDVYRVTVRLTRAEVGILKSFWEDTLIFGSLPFDWFDPRTREPVTFRFGEAAPVPRHAGGHLWDVPLDLEVLP